MWGVGLCEMFKVGGILNTLIEAYQILVLVAWF